LAEQAKRRVRILLAEDNPVNQKVALKILEKLGYRADVASDGIEALEALRTKPYDLVLMDVQIPGMDGLEVTRRVRSSESGATDPRVPIIALTAHAMEGDRKTCLDAGMDDYLVKPIKPGDLSDVLARWAVAAGTEPSGAIRKPLAREQAAAAGASSERGLDADCRVFDERVLLRLLDGDRASAAEIASGYLADVPSQISAVRAALEMGDAVEVRCRAHALKGSSANVGADCLRRLAAALDEGAAVGDLDGAGSLVASMERQLVLLQERATLNGGLL
jgi:CheY-like chemotaxis protein